MSSNWQIKKYSSLTISNELFLTVAVFTAWCTSLHCDLLQHGAHWTEARQQRREHTLVSSFAVTANQETLSTSDKTATAAGCALWSLPGQFQPDAGPNPTIFSLKKIMFAPIKYKQFRLELLKTFVQFCCPYCSLTIRIFVFPATSTNYAKL